MSRVWKRFFYKIAKPIAITLGGLIWVMVSAIIVVYIGLEQADAGFAFIMISFGGIGLAYWVTTVYNTVKKEIAEEDLEMLKAVRGDDSKKLTSEELREAVRQKARIDAAYSSNYKKIV